MRSTRKVLTLNTQQLPKGLNVTRLNTEQSYPTILIIVYSHVANAHIRDHWRKYIGAKKMDDHLQLITIFYIGQPRNTGEEEEMRDELKNRDMLVSVHEDHEASFYLKGAHLGTLSKSL
jgi:hypothetical protein